MRKVLYSLLFAVSASTMALSSSVYKLGSVDLYSTPRYTPTGMCDKGTQMVMDEATLTGKVVFLANFVKGRCRLYIAPYERHYRMEESKRDSCGSYTHKGIRMNARGRAETIKIIDHRDRICEDLPPASIIVEESGGGVSEDSYSVD